MGRAEVGASSSSRLLFIVKGQTESVEAPEPLQCTGISPQRGWAGVPKLATVSFQPQVLSATQQSWGCGWGQTAQGWGSIKPRSQVTQVLC